MTIDWWSNLIGEIKKSSILGNKKTEIKGSFVNSYLPNHQHHNILLVHCVLVPLGVHMFTLVIQRFQSNNSSILRVWMKQLIYLILR